MGGSGIGLAVVRELVAAHGGTVALASGDRAGTSVTIRFPMKRTIPTGVFAAGRDRALTSISDTPWGIKEDG